MASPRIPTAQQPKKITPSFTRWCLLQSLLKGTLQPIHRRSLSIHTSVEVPHNLKLGNFRWVNSKLQNGSNRYQWGHGYSLAAIADIKFDLLMLFASKTSFDTMYDINKT